MGVSRRRAVAAAPAERASAGGARCRTREGERQLQDDASAPLRRRGTDPPAVSLHDRRGDRIERAGDVVGRRLCHATLQCAQMPEISITGVFGVKPAAREAVLMVSATAAEAASPTAPHFSQIRNTTGSWLS